MPRATKTGVPLGTVSPVVPVRLSLALETGHPDILPGKLVVGADHARLERESTLRRVKVDENIIVKIKVTSDEEC
jgi:hypothetical protein